MAPTHATRTRCTRDRHTARPLDEIVGKHEAGASTGFQKLLRETISPVDPTDSRTIEILATGVSCYNGKLLFCDATLRSPLDVSALSPRAAHDGVVVHCYALALTILGSFN